MNSSRPRRKSRPIAHPDWLKEAMKDFKTTTRIYNKGILPDSIEFFMVTTPIHRMMRCCFRNQWALLWWTFCRALAHERERLSGMLYRFWRYRIQMKSQEADLHRILTSVCPRCNDRCEIPRVGEDSYKCDGCHAVMDFGELVMSQPEEDDDE